MKHSLLILTLILFGCSGSSTVEKDFLCAAQDGTPCATIGEADGSTTQHTLGVQEQREDAMLASLSQDDPGSKAATAYAGLPTKAHGYDGDRYRVPEVIGRLWLAPYLDEHKILHEARFVHFVVSESRWVKR